MTLLVVFLASRVLWIASNPESSSYWEEAYRWLAVEKLATGATLPVSDYQADHYQGGSLVVILLAAALRWLGVDSLVALKAVALLFSGGTLVALYAVGRVFFGRLVALLCGSIYLLGPPLVAYWGVVAMGFHAESVALSLCILGVFLALVEGIWLGPRAWLGFGMLSGVAIWFTPTAGITVAACVVAWPVLAERPKASSLAIAVAGLVLGLTPWIAYNLVHDFAGIERILEVFGVRSAADPWRSQSLVARAADLLLRVPSQGWLDPGGLHGRWPAYALFAGVWLPAGVALAAALGRALRVVRVRSTHRDVEARREFVFLVYGLVFSLVYLGSRFTVGVDPSPISYRLFVPLAVLLIPPIAVSASRGLRAGGLRARASAIACAMALCSLFAATSSFAVWHAEASVLRSLDQGYIVWGRLMHQKHSRNVAAAVDGARQVATGRNLDRILRGIGWGMEYAYEQGDLLTLARSLEPISPGDRSLILKGLHWELDNRRDDLARALREGEVPELRRMSTHLDTLAQWLADPTKPIPGDERGPPSVVLITLDTTRVDHLSCYGYERQTTPRLDAFAARAVRYRRAWSTSSWTLPAHASLFTGLYPSRHGAHYDPQGDAVLGEVVNFPVAQLVKAGKLPDDVTTLAELLAERGYQTGAFVAGPWLYRSFGLLQGFQTKDDRIAGFAGRPADEISRNAIAWLRGLEPDKPYLLFANYFDPHAPYQPAREYADLPRAREAFEPPYDDLMRGRVTLDADQRAILRDRYDAEIRVMDGELGRLLDEVMSRPGSEHTIVIITADHGEALGEEGRFGHGFWLSEELIRVPLIVRMPFDRDGGSWSKDMVQLVDILRLLADEIGMTLPDDIDSISLGQREVAFVELYHETTTALRYGKQYAGDLQVAIRWPHKLLRSNDGDETLLLLSEAGVGERVVEAKREGAALASQLDRHSAKRSTRSLVVPEVDLETLEALRKLGYLE